MVIFGILLIACNSDNIEEETSAAGKAISNYLEGVKNKDVNQVVSNSIDLTFKDQEKLVAFYERDIQENELLEYTIKDVSIINPTSA